MPVHQISVVPVAKETASNGRTSSRTKDTSKEKEGEKEIRRSGSRSSNISKTSSSNQGAGPNSLSRASVTPSSQDICSSSVPLKVEANHPDQTTVVLPISPAPSSVPVTKRQVKRRHRRRRESSGGGGGGGGAAGCVAECVDVQQQTVRARANTHSRTRTHSDSSDEEEQDERRWRETRSWSRQKARRHRSGSHPAHATTHPLDEAGSARDGTQLLSVCSDEGQKENQPPPVDEGTTGTGLKSRRKRSSKGEEQGSKAANHSRGSGRSSGRGSGRGSGRASEEEERQTITKSYEERGSGDSNMAVPTSQKCTNTTTPTANQNGCTQMPCSDDEMEVCRICHCEGDEDCPLITPCHCTGSLRFVHQDCLHQWIKSSDTRCCELCKFDFIMETHLKPLRKWEKLHMTTCELRKIYFSVSFHLFAVVCVIWSLYVLIDRTAEEIKQGKNQEFLRFSLLNAVGVLEWPFWTKLIVVAVGLAGGLVFMYVQCKVYLQLWRRLKAFNRIIFVQNCPATVRAAARPAPVTNGKHEGPAPGTQTNIPRSASTGSAGVAPV